MPVGQGSRAGQPLVGPVAGIRRRRRRGRSAGLSCRRPAARDTRPDSWSAVLAAAGTAQQHSGGLDAVRHAEHSQLLPVARQRRLAADSFRPVCLAAHPGQFPHPAPTGILFLPFISYFPGCCPCRMIRASLMRSRWGPHRLHLSAHTCLHMMSSLRLVPGNTPVGTAQRQCCHSGVQSPVHSTLPAARPCLLWHAAGARTSKHGCRNAKRQRDRQPPRSPSLLLLQMNKGFALLCVAYATSNARIQTHQEVRGSRYAMKAALNRPEGLDMVAAAAATAVAWKQEGCPAAPTAPPSPQQAAPCPFCRRSCTEGGVRHFALLLLRATLNRRAGVKGRHLASVGHRHASWPATAGTLLARCCCTCGHLCWSEHAWLRRELCSFIMCEIVCAKPFRGMAREKEGRLRAGGSS